MSKAHSFFDMFDCCGDDPQLLALLQDAQVPEVVIDRERLHMDVTIRFQRPAAPVSVSAIERELGAYYGLRSVTIAVRNPVPAAAAPVEAGGTPKAASPAKRKADKVIMGRAVKGEPVRMKDVSLESGKVHVAGDVFACEHRFLEKRKAWVLSFCVTDQTNSLRVSKFFPDEEQGKAICSQITNGLFLHVRGNTNFNRYDGDLGLEPTDMFIGQKKEREDLADEKRVELHLHTRFSSQDGLTNPTEAIALAAKWGHPAIAITDHGVAQAFPEASSAGKRHGIKVIYGLEGYYINDCDDRLVVSGDCDLDLDGEFVAFDLETTGLRADRERITEIGAVLVRNGEIGDTFQTFVNPEKPIPPEITRLTGITDADVKDAPLPDAALRAFLDFAGDRPLVAHNASFDMGFVAAACERAEIPFSHIAIDTLTMAQNLLPHLRRHKLNEVADHLGLPAFNHHRASDDAKTVAHMLGAFFPRLREMGISNVNQINDHMRGLRAGARGQSRPQHIILLAQNQTGLRNLYKLISLSHLKHFKRFPIIPKSLLLENREGLIIGSACEAGEVFSAVLSGKNQAELRRIASFYDYLEIQPICNNRFLVESGKVQSNEDLKNLNREILRLGEVLGKPVVATGDVHFLHPEQEEYRRVLLASKGFADADKHLPLYLKSTYEMLEEFSYLGEETAHQVVVENPRKIADMCEAVRPLPEGLFTPKIENSAEELRALVLGKMQALYGENPPEIVRERVEIELGDIIGKNYDVIYMSAQKLVQNSIEAGYLVGSRGSVGSSIVAFLSGITEVNSLPAHYRCPACQHADFDAGADYGCGADMPDAPCVMCGADYVKDGFDIPFATFLGFGGDKVPDIDLNFSGEYQARAHKAATELFGEAYVFRSGTIGTLASKTAYGYVKKYLEERHRVVTRAEENRLTEGLVGVKRTTGQHPGGLVIIPQDKEIYDFCPVQHPADDRESGIITTHFEYKAMEDNLLKLDLLGHDDPTMIKYMEDLTGVDARQIPLDDPETMSIFQSPLALGLPEDDPIIGKTGSIAVPEFGTGFTREMLNDTKPDAFATLVQLSGFSHGTDVWLGNAKDLILDGIATVSEAIGCRDDIMLFLISKGVEEKMAFGIMESVRKGRGLKPEWEAAMNACGVPKWYIESCQKIKYLFPKAHAVAYVMMAFRIAWFKVHHPLAFYSAYFTVRAKAFDAVLMCRGIDIIRAKIDEIVMNPEPTNVEKEMLVTLEVCYEMYLRGIVFGQMDLYRSAATEFLIDGNQLIPPFEAAAGLGELAALDLVRYREGTPFISIEDLQRRCPKVTSAHVEQLKRLGVLAALPDTSQVTLF